VCGPRNPLMPVFDGKSMSVPRYTSWPARDPAGGPDRGGGDSVV